jgi:hypothetical protein
MSTPIKPKWSDRRSYQQWYRSQPHGKCECGNPATVERSWGWICARCAKNETTKAQDAFHRATCGIPDGGGMPVHALCL